MKEGSSRAQNAAVAEIVEFLRKVPPFQFLDEAPLQELARVIRPQYYPTGTVILQQGGPPSAHLLVVKKGGAKVFVRSPENEEILVDYRAEGDVIGFLSLYTGDRSRTNVVTTEDTICFLVGKEDFRRLLDANPLIREYLHRAFLRKYLDRTLQEMRTRSVFVGGGERLLFTTPVGEIATGAVVTAPRGISIQAAAEIMSRSRISSLILLEADGSPAGIVTDRDIRDKVVATGRSVTEPVTNIMNAPLVTADSRDFCFEALLGMLRHNIHHLPVVEEGKLSGIVTNHDLMILQGTSPLSVSQEIAYQQDLEGLAAAAKKVPQIVVLLLKDGARGGNITNVVAEIDDLLVRRVLEFAERRLGPPPLRYAWLVLGSEGRREQVFKTDQDNAIIYQDPEGPAAEEEARRYFAAMAEYAGKALLACGYPPCPGGFMAGNPLWCQPLHVWKRYFADWIQGPTEGGPLQSMIFFDFRAVHGDRLLGEQLRDHLTAQLASQRAFLPFVANRVVTNRPPIGFFQRFVVEKSGEHKDQLNLKARGLNPLVDTVRFLSLEKGLRETSTVERIAALRGPHSLIEEHADELVQALDFLILLRAHSQYQQMSAGDEVDNFITPHRLSNLEKRTIKESFQVVSRVQDLVLERYKASIL